MRSYVLISLFNGNVRRVMNELKSYEQVQNAHLLFGEWDIITEISVRNPEELGQFVLEKIRAREDVKLTSSLIVAGE